MTETESRQVRRAQARSAEPRRLYLTSPFGNRAARRAHRPAPAEGQAPRRIVYSPTKGKAAPSLRRIVAQRCMGLLFDAAAARMYKRMQQAGGPGWLPCC